MATTAAPVSTLRAVGYTRVSTAGQATERNISLDTQLLRYQQYCHTRGYSVGQVFTDIASGRKDNRLQYQALLAFLREGKADVVVVQYVDRFGRNPREILRRIWELEDRGIRVEATDEDVREEIVLLVRAGLAGQESRKTAERVSANLWNGVTRGMKPGSTPYGIKAVRHLDDQGKVRITGYVLEPEESAVIRRMYELTVQHNYGAMRTADTLNAEGKRTRNGQPWTMQSVLKVLYNPAHVGTLVYGRVRTVQNAQRGVVEKEGVYPALFTPEEWAILQQRRAIHQELSRGHARVSDYLLSGIARCGLCGAAMTGIRSKKTNGEVYRSYVCSRKHGKASMSCPDSKYVSCAKLEKAVLDFLGQYTDESVVRQMLEVTDGEAVARVEKERTAVRKRLAELDAALLKDLDRLDRGILTEAEYSRVAEMRRAEQGSLKERETVLTEQLQREKRMAEQAEALPHSITDFFAAVSGMRDIQEQKALLQGILKTAHVYPHGRIELEFR